ncbi:ROK family protein [Hydrogenimonas sp.]
MSRLAIDIGGTWLRYELVGEEEVCGKVSSRDTGLAVFIEKMIQERPGIDAVAVSYAGQVHEGTILSAPNIAVDEADLASWAEARFGIPLRLENDLNCAALAEAVYWQTDSLVALYSGTGLGAGLVEKGEICHGFRSLAGEIGHVPFKEAPFPCGCGKRNCLELYASGSGLEKWRDHLGCGVSDLEGLARSGDPNCRGIAEAYEEALLHAAATLVTVCNPAVLVLGGGVVTHNPWLLKRLEKRLGDYALHAALEGFRLELSKIENASLEGAKLLLDTL